MGTATSDELFVRDHAVEAIDAADAAGARAVLADPSVEAAVLEVGRGGILRDGLGYDESDVAVLTNVQLDHLGQDGIEDRGELLRIKSLVAERVRVGGTLVLNADD